MISGYQCDVTIILNQFFTLFQARVDARLVGIRAKKAREAAENAENAKTKGK